MSYNPLHDRDAGRWGDMLLAYTTAEAQLKLHFYTCRYIAQLNEVLFFISVVEYKYMYLKIKQVLKILEYSYENLKLHSYCQTIGINTTLKFCVSTCGIHYCQHY
jgi:hypothetical protein